MEWLANPEIWIAFLTLLLLEVVLGIDNIVFISILSGKLPKNQQPRARTLGLLGAMLTRLLLLFSLSWLAGLTAPLVTLLGQEISGRDLVLMVGGLFLLVKSTMEIHERLEGEEAHGSGTAVAAASFMGVIVQIMLLDVVFSLDSVITAVGMVDELPVMVAAIVGAIIIMLISAGTISDFVNRHPSIKMLALSFLLLIGATLIMEGFDVHIPKGYVYGPIAFSLFVEALNLRAGARGRPREEPVHLRPYIIKQGTPGRPLPSGRLISEEGGVLPSLQDAGTPEHDHLDATTQSEHRDPESEAGRESRRAG